VTTMMKTITPRAPLGGLATACLIALAACGSATPGSQSTKATGDQPTTAAQSGRTSPTTAPTSREAVIRQCATAAGGDPASASLCLAHHGVTLETTGQLLSCMSSANDRAGATACLARYAR
jgi:uncharacterized membrane protein